jgi:hypothetical protein
MTISFLLAATCAGWTVSGGSEGWPVPSSTGAWTETPIWGRTRHTDRQHGHPLPRATTVGSEWTSSGAVFDGPQRWNPRAMEGKVTKSTRPGGVSPETEAEFTLRVPGHERELAGSLRDGRVLGASASTAPGTKNFATGAGKPAFSFC